MVAAAAAAGGVKENKNLYIKTFNCTIANINAMIKRLNQKNTLQRMLNSPRRCGVSTALLTEPTATDARERTKTNAF